MRISFYQCAISGNAKREQHQMVKASNAFRSMQIHLQSSSEFGPQKFDARVFGLDKEGVKYVFDLLESGGFREYSFEDGVFTVDIPDPHPPMEGWCKRCGQEDDNALCLSCYKDENLSTTE